MNKDKGEKGLQMFVEGKKQKLITSALVRSSLRGSKDIGEGFINRCTESGREFNNIMEWKSLTSLLKLVSHLFCTRMPDNR